MNHKFLRLLFYHQYVWQEKVGNDDVAAFTTILWMSFSTFLVVIGIYSLLSLLFPFIKFVVSVGGSLVLLILGVIIYYFLTEYRYDYKRMVQLTKVKVGKNGKVLWIICMFVLPILEIEIVCGLWCLNNNGIISLR